MDFHSLKRRDLQTLCKRNNIQANMTNAAMTDALASLHTVEGVEEFLRQAESEGMESPERSVITSPNASRSLTCQRNFKEDVECSKLATRSRCGARSKAAKGTETKQTVATRTTRRRAQKEPSIQQKMEEDMQAEYEADLEQSEATRTTRRRAQKEPSIQQKMEEDMQAEYEANLEQSEVTENKGLLPGGGECESTNISDFSGVMDQEGHLSSESQNEPQDQVYEQKEHLKEDHVLNEAQDVLSTEMLNGSQKVDFHNLSRKELQNLCKRNKIPANSTSAAMAEALEALESVEGLEDFLKAYDPLAAKSPETSRVTSSRVRQTRTCQKTTWRKAAQAGSALGKIESIQKKEDSIVQKMDLSMEDRECPVSISAGDVLSMEVEEDMQSHLEACPEKPEVPDCVSKNSCGISESKSVTEEVSDESDAYIVVETGTEPQDDVVDNKFDGGEKAGTETELCDSSSELESNLNGSNDADEELKPVTDQFPADVLGQKASNLWETEDTLQEDALQNEVDGHEEVKANYCEESDNNGSLKSDTISSDELYVGEGLMQEGPGGGNEGFEEYDDILSDLQEDKFRLEDDDGKDVGINIENLEQLGNTMNQRDGIVFEDMSVGDSNVVPEDLIDMVNVESVSKCDTQDESLNFVSASVKFSNEAQEMSSLEINADNESEICPVEKFEGSHAKEDQMTKKFNSESTTQADEHAPKVKGTPLCHKSLRKLKRMLKEKLQATTLLTTKMENLTLEESEIKEASDEFFILAVSGVDDDAPVSAVISSGTTNDDLDEESKGDVIVTTESNDNGEVTSVFKDEVGLLVATSILVDHEISEDFAVGPINIETVNCDESFDQGEKQSSELVPLKQVGVTESDNINCLQFTPCKSLRKTQKPLLTPSKTSTMSALDINKENIDNSACKTLPGKMEIAVAGSGKILSAMSMGTLKKEFRSLQQQSEKKRQQALQSHSENQCPLASP